VKPGTVTGTWNKNTKRKETKMLQDKKNILGQDKIKGILIK
jgi:hypothetical protein